MKYVTVTSVKARDDFAAHINKAAYGNTVALVMRRGEPICKLAPLDQSDIDAYLKLKNSHEMHK